MCFCLVVCDALSAFIFSFIFFFFVSLFFFFFIFFFFFFQAEDGIRDLVRSRGLGDVYKRQVYQAAEKVRYRWFSQWTIQKDFPAGQPQQQRSRQAAVPSWTTD